MADSYVLPAAYTEGMLDENGAPMSKSEVRTHARVAPRENNDGSAF